MLSFAVFQISILSQLAFHYVLLRHEIEIVVQLQPCWIPNASATSNHCEQTNQSVI